LIIDIGKKGRGASSIVFSQVEARQQQRDKRRKVSGEDSAQFLFNNQQPPQMRNNTGMKMNVQNERKNTLLEEVKENHMINSFV